MRGWSQLLHVLHAHIELFPAHVGVIRHVFALPAIERAFPRACGSDPSWFRPPSNRTSFSPRMWEWSSNFCPHPPIQHDNFTFASSIPLVLERAECEMQALNETVESVKGSKLECDKLDYILAVSSGALCGIMDIFWLANLVNRQLERLQINGLQTKQWGCKTRRLERRRRKICNTFSWTEVQDPL